MPLTLISPAFAEGDRLPEKYVRTDRNLSPPLRWSGVPEGAKGLALVMEDPDAPRGTFRHWIVYDLSPERTDLPESVETGPERGALRVAPNDFDHRGYDGPQPPEGDPPHRYRFRLFALDAPKLDLPADVGAERIVREIEKRAVEEATLEATYGR